jgi:hypothetical protein
MSTKFAVSYIVTKRYVWRWHAYSAPDGVDLLDALAALLYMYEYKWHEHPTPTSSVDVLTNVPSARRISNAGRSVHRHPQTDVSWLRAVALR